MKILTDRTILILSPQAWGKMFISKHHYAIELARQGNKVFFLNPPNLDGQKGKINIQPSGVQENLFLINQELYFPYIFKFHALPVFHFLMRWQIKKILKSIPGKVDLIWSFDIGNFYPFRFFPDDANKIFHPVDEPTDQSAINAADGADIIFSVTREILDKYKHLPIPRIFINHGIAEIFLNSAVNSKKTPGSVHVGFSGNLLRKDLDRDIVLQIVRENTDVHFDFWGSYKNSDSNIGGSEDKDLLAFIHDLKSFHNVLLHGPVSVEQLAMAYEGMDAFLICYDINKDQSKGTNYHKVMEFLSTGKVVISNNITTYQQEPGLIEMTRERNSNAQLPVLFKKVINNLVDYNSPDKIAYRKSFALNNTYAQQLIRISGYLEEAAVKNSRKGIQKTAV